MRKLINDKDLDKIELIMSLCHRCSVLELLVVDQMQITGELKCKAMEVQGVDHSLEPIETRLQFKRALEKKNKNQATY